MQEIWLGLNIICETLRPLLGVWILLALIWLASLVVAWRCPGAQWRKVMPTVLLVGIVSAVAVMVMGPALTSSSFGELNYWVDWAFLGGSALGFGVLLAVMVWPALAWFSRRA